MNRLVFIIIYSISFSQGYLHVENGEIVDGSGSPVLLKGFGLGGWLVPEGYMLHNRAWVEGFESPTDVENHVLNLIGPELAEEFWTGWHDNYVNKNDIDMIAQWGFNSLRIPFHYKQFSESIGTINPYGYEIVDSLISWCAPHNMYIILDMHCAPGAQNEGPISDSDGTAGLWLDDNYKAHAIEIWEDIATYYTNEPLIGGYDLINEPVLPSGVSSIELRQLYIDITDAIRQVDSNHIVFIEGNWYGTDFTDLTPPWDENMSYSFHKYWGDISISTINYLLNIREQYNIPLWLGETGENSNQWYYEIVTLCENNNIGWNWWTHKKFEKITSPLNVIITEEYNALIDYWSGEAAQPLPAEAENALFGMIENMKIENCTMNPGVIPSLMDPEFGQTAVPVKDHTIPGLIAAVDYDIGGVGLAYNDSDYMNTGDGSYNSGWTYRNDGVDIEKNGNDINGMNYNVGWIDAGDWMGYTINDVQEGMYNIELSVSSSGGSGVLNVLLNGESVGYKTVENTGGWYNWQVITIPNIQIESAPQHLKVMTLQPGYNIESIQFVRIVGGCTDNTACNYDPNAESDDGTCAYTVDCAGVCDGSSLEDACGVCDDDATNDDFTCTGCLDETACNFDEEVIIEGVCEYAAEGFDCSGNALSIERWIPAEYDLAQNYPNPFNPSTVISFSLPEYTKVSLLVYDVHGRVVSTLVSDALSPGVYHYSWNGKSDDGQNLPSGIFFYALETTGHHYNYLQKRKMLFIK